MDDANIGNTAGQSLEKCWKTLCSHEIMLHLTELDIHRHFQTLIETASDHLPRIYLMSNLGGNVHLSQYRVVWQNVHYLS